MIENIWPTPIYYNYIDNLEEIQEEISGVMGSVIFMNPNPNWGETLNVSNLFGGDFLEIHNLHKTKKMIIDHLNLYCQDIGYQFHDNYNLESWMTSSKLNDHGKLHHHGSSDISGVYYYKTNGNDGDLIFEIVDKPAFSRCFSGKYAHPWIHKPEIGKIIIFPSWVLHYVTKNLTNNERNSLSFNIHFKND